VPSSGQVLVNNESVATMPARRVRRCGARSAWCSRIFKLLPRKTVFENVAYITQVIGLPPREQRARTYQMLRDARPESSSAQFPRADLRRRAAAVAIARALVNRPLIPAGRRADGKPRPRAVARNHGALQGHQRHGTTVLIATHDRAMITRMARRVIGLEHGGCCRMGDDRDRLLGDGLSAARSAALHRRSLGRSAAQPRLTSLTILSIGVSLYILGLFLLLSLNLNHFVDALGREEQVQVYLKPTSTPSDRRPEAPRSTAIPPSARPATCPRALHHHRGDTLVPPAYQQKVVDVYAGPKRFLKMTGVDHNDPIPDRLMPELHR